MPKGNKRGKQQIGKREDEIEREAGRMVMKWDDEPPTTKTILCVLLLNF